MHAGNANITSSISECVTQTTGSFFHLEKTEQFKVPTSFHLKSQVWISSEKSLGCEVGNRVTLGVWPPRTQELKRKKVMVNWHQFYVVWNNGYLLSTVPSEMKSRRSRSSFLWLVTTCSSLVSLSIFFFSCFLVRIVFWVNGSTAAPVCRWTQVKSHNYKA